MSNILKSQLIALREMSQAMVSMIDNLLPALERPPAPSETGACLHPEGQRIKTPVMGAPGRWICGACGVTGGTASITNSTPQEG